MFTSVGASLPATDVARAKAFYQDKLDLKPGMEMEDGSSFYELGGAWFMLYPSEYAGTNKATAAAFTVDDVEGTVAELRGRGVQFIELSYETMHTVDGIMTMPDGNKVAWFTDSEGNIIGISTDMRG